MNENKLKLKLYKGLGSELGLRAQQILKAAFSIKPITKGISFMSSIIKQTLDKVPLLHDRIYYFVDWETWLQLIKYDWADKKKYLADRRDCDNFADSFNARMSEIYGLNTAGRFTCQVYDANTGKHLFAHRACLIVCSDNSVYAFEPQTDQYVKVEKGKPIVIGTWEYRLVLSEFN